MIHLTAAWIFRFVWLIVDVDVYNKGKMCLLWIEDFPLFLPKEDGSEGLLLYDNESI